MDILIFCGIALAFALLVSLVSLIFLYLALVHLEIRVLIRRNIARISAFSIGIAYFSVAVLQILVLSEIYSIEFGSPIVHELKWVTILGINLFQASVSLVYMLVIASNIRTVVRPTNYDDPAVTRNETVKGILRTNLLLTLVLGIPLIAAASIIGIVFRTCARLAQTDKINVKSQLVTTCEPCDIVCLRQALKNQQIASRRHFTDEMTNSVDDMSKQEIIEALFEISSYGHVEKVMDECKS
jgi:hypothetical protein